jgi:tetratricopeptide (TPR) repeat protein
LRRALTTWDSTGDRGEQDPRRAELWRRLGDAERARGDDRAALAAYQRAVSVAPDSDGALAARRGLVGLATTAGRPAGESLAALVEADQVPVDVLALARELARGERFDDARAMFELARTLGARPDANDDQVLTAHPARAMASDEAYGAVIDDADRRALVDDDGDAPLADLLELLWEAAPLLCPDARTALDHEGLGEARRVSAATEAAAARIYPQIANALGGPPTLVHAMPRGSHPDLSLLVASPPIVVLGPRLAAMRARTTADVDTTRDLELRFHLGRIVELARPRRIFTRSPRFAQLIAALLQAFAGAPPGSDAVTAQAERLKSVLPMLLRRRLADKLGGTPRLDAGAYVAACERAADRSGLLACGHVGLATELAGGAAAARHVVRLAASPRYLVARRSLRSRRAT